MWLAFVAASNVLLLIPGPTVLLVLSYALSQGRKVALATVAGVALGDFLAMTASLLGLGALVLASATAFTVLKWVGAAYLIWLGFRMLKGAGRARMDGLLDAPAETPRAVFSHAAIVTALNPKSIGFFIAFVPQFIDPTRQISVQFAIMIVTFVSFASLNALAYALLADRLRARMSRPTVLRNLTRLGGVTLMGMGIFTALMRRST
ncbi:Threonine/homoserine/homoserine lactone efflux protein [Shimia gijangensis]|uniref:Threonine/homoserine/homoserine lactone efflux protein n=2 Tax=Shimia gijangensis TaxID=1470563 RepID=A0A1M6P654_9RHOB|nr:Threonine/homoserine/homoserine lactone efflux protein [Shimia gijangensis]